MLECPLAHEIVLVELDDPGHVRLERIRLGVGVLADENVHFLQAKDTLRLESEWANSEVLAPLEDRVPDVLAVRAREVKLIAQLAHEADPEDERRHARDACLARVEVAERLIRDVHVRKPLHEVASPRSGDVQRCQSSGYVHDLGVHAPDRVPPLEPLEHRACSGRGRGHVVGLVIEPCDRAVVHDPARIRVQDRVPNAAGLHVREPVRIETLEELSRLGPADEHLPERRDVDDADGSVHRTHLGLHVSVRVWSSPGACPHHARAEFLVPVMDGCALGRLVRAPGEDSERHGRPGRAGRCRPDRARVRFVLPRVDANRGQMAQAALARAHRDRRVALRQLDRIEPLGDRSLQVLVRHVLADADETLPGLRRAVIGRSWNRGGNALACRGSNCFDAVRDLRGNEDAPVGVVLDPRARLREQRIRWLASAGHDE